jgi:hypothetical protein
MVSGDITGMKTAVGQPTRHRLAMTCEPLKVQS